MHNIPFAKPSISDLEVAYAADAAKSGWGSKCYDYINRFEESFSRYVGAKFSIATSSCTGAIHIALRAIGLSPGDEVIVPEITWIASVAPVNYQGATPVFVDVDPKTWCIDINDIKNKITKKTKAIIAVHLYGNLCNLRELSDLCRANNIALIEDAAEAIGSMQGDKKAGSVGDFGVFSFHGTKTMTTGEGGMLVCNSPHLYEKALVQSNHGRKASKHTTFWMDELGVKYKMSNIQAAVGLAQLERIDSLVKRKREIFSIYKDHLQYLPLSMNYEAPCEVNSYWLPTVVFDKISEENRDDLLKKANQIGIGLRPFFYSLCRFPMYSNHCESPVAKSLSRRGLNLPSYHDMTDDDIETVVNFVKRSAEFGD